MTPTEQECLEAAAEIYGSILADPEMAEILRDESDDEQVAS